MEKNERSAMLALRKKIFETTTQEERVENFVNTYTPDELHTADEWIEAHQILTGACYVGSHRFIKKMGIKRYEKFTTLEFLEITKNAYDHDVIKDVLKKYKEAQNDHNGNEE